MTRFIQPAERFGRLTTVQRATLNGKAAWLCQCDCGKETTIQSGALRNGHTQSCGCLWREAIKRAATTHGQTADYRKTTER